MLNEFVAQYDKSVISRRAAEEDEDVRTINTKAVLSTIPPTEIKVESGECYTRNLFEILNKELIAANSCSHETKSTNSSFIDYKVALINVDNEFQQ